MKTTPTVIATIVSLTALCAVSEINAATAVSWSGTANIDTVGDNLSSLVGIGDELQVLLSYNADASPSSTTSSETFYGLGADVYLRFTLGALIWEGTQHVNPGARTAVIQNDIVGVADNLIAILQDNWSTASSNAEVTGPGATRLRLYFHSASTALFDDDALPEPQNMDLSKLTSFYGYIDSNSSSTRFTGQVATVSVIPEPTSISLLFMASIVGFNFFKRKIRRA